MRKTILLTRDGILERILENSFFCREGFRMLQAVDGRKALAAIEEQDPDLAILTLDMAGLGGDDCCRAVKGDPVLRTTAVVLVGNSMTEQDLERCRGAGCDGILQRPLKGSEVLELACTLLGIGQRAVPRISTCFKVLCAAPGGKAHAGTALDLTLGGLYVATSDLVPVDTLVSLEFRLPESAATLQCQGRVAWVNHPEWIKKSVLPVGMGVQFVAPGADVLECIGEHLAARICALD